MFALQEVNQTAAAPLLGEIPAGYYPCPGNGVPLKADNHAAAVARMLEKRGVQYHWSWLPAKKMCIRDSLIRVVRVEEQGQVLVDGGLVKGNAVMDDALVDGIQIEQMQGVGAALVTGDSQLVQPGSRCVYETGSMLFYNALACQMIGIMHL